MPTWSGIGREILELSQDPAKRVPGVSPFVDEVRRKYLAMLAGREQRNVILYATAFTQANPGIPPGVYSITDADMQGIMEVVSGLDGRDLDLIIHSPGGSIEATEALVRYLRSKFDHIRVFVPHLAMSAATMIACSADRIVMGGHSSLGPVDPQFQMQTPLGIRNVPVDAVIAQFERAKEECQDPRKLASWAPMLSQYGPDLIEQCENAQELSRSLVTEWLSSYMFRDNDDAHDKASAIASWLANHKKRGTHSRHLCRQELQDKGLVIDALEESQELQDIVLSIFHATTHTFSGTRAVKIIENHTGRLFVEQVVQQAIPIPQQQRPPDSGSLI